MHFTDQPPEVNPRHDCYDQAQPAYGVTFLRQRVFRVLRNGPLHAHRDQTQVLIVLEGRLALQAGSRRSCLSVGEGLVLPDAMPHRLLAAGSASPLTFLDLRVIAGAGHDLGRFLDALPAARPLRFDPALLATAVESLARAPIPPGWQQSPRVLAGLWQLIAALELPQTLAPLAGKQGVRDHRLRRAEAFILQNLGEEIAVAEIAVAAGLSRSQLSRLYRQELGVGPAERLRDYRVSAARRLLAGGRMSVKEVAHAVGFRWVHHFIRTYRALRGHTPSLDLGVDE